MADKSTPGGYQLLDEINSAPLSSQKRPWSPTGIFFITVLFAPMGALLFGLNWARFNRPERRASVFAAGIFALVFPFIIALGAQSLAIALSRDVARLAVALISIAIAYWQLFDQRPVFDAYIRRGGQAGSTRALWLCALLVIVGFVVTVLLRTKLPGSYTN